MPLGMIGHGRMGGSMLGMAEWSGLGYV
jgi:hypothetical protein